MTAATSASCPALDLPMAREIERLVRTHGMLFLVTDLHGDITPPGARELGMFHDDTRHLSYYALTVADAETVRLSSEASHDAYDQIDLMLTDAEGEFLDDPKNFLHIRRRQILDGGLMEEVRFTNFLLHSVRLKVTIRFAADFADIFEVRGAHRSKRGVSLAPWVGARGVSLRYDGLCGFRYETKIEFDPRPAELGPDHAIFELRVAPGEDWRLEVHVQPSRGSNHRWRQEQPFHRRVERLSQKAAVFRASCTEWSCDDGVLQGVLDQSRKDLYALRISIPNPAGAPARAGGHPRHQAILGAGVPWFCAPFGRDALVSAYEALLLNPDLAIEALRTLAAYQGVKYDDEHEEEPGKIHHELRFGEMARSGEIPHSPYYGSVDATPLFVVLADALYEATADVSILRELRPALQRALAWVDVRSGEGISFVTYERRSKQGLDNQGWKDSRAGVSFPDGRRAEPPIALCEVQGYCADAYMRAERLFRVLGDEPSSRAYAQRGLRMREKIEQDLWLPELDRYAFAVDGQGRKLTTVVSNAGHLAWSRVPSHDRAVATGRLMMEPRMFSGFGVRTLGADQPVYNPLSYHNGTVWPHDNALIADGLARYGLYPELGTLFTGLYHAMTFFRDGRIPELFCGIERGSGPLVRYPVAGSPQAWSAASPFLLLQSMLGLRADAPARRLVVKNPQMPSFLRRIEFRNMRVGSARVSMRFRRVGGRCHIDRLDVTGGPLKTEIEMD